MFDRKVPIIEGDNCWGANSLALISLNVAWVISTSDYSDVLLLSKVRDFENFGSRSEVGLSKPIRGRGSGRDRVQIPSHKCDLSEPIRGSECQN